MTYLEALQDALAAEHAALYVVGYLGAQTSSSSQPDLYAGLTDAYDEHRALRDVLGERVRATGGVPVPAAAAYDLVDVGGDPARIRRRAVSVERACSAAYGFLVANSSPDQRRFAVEALIETALRETVLGGAPRALPGR